MKLALSVDQYYNMSVFQLFIYVFLIDGAALSRKILIFRKNSPKNPSNIVFLVFAKKFNQLMCFLFTLKMIQAAFFMTSKTPFLGKICLFSYGQQCSQPVRLHYPLIINISGRNQLIS